MYFHLILEFSCFFKYLTAFWISSKVIILFIFSNIEVSFPSSTLCLNLVCFVIGFGSVLSNSGLMVNFLLQFCSSHFFEIVLVSAKKSRYLNGTYFQYFGEVPVNTFWIYFCIYLWVRNIGFSNRDYQDSFLEHGMLALVFLAFHGILYQTNC